MAKIFTKLKSVDFFKKLPSDLAEATLTGAWISILATILMVLLFVMELSSFLQLKTATELVVDQSSPADKLRVNFNISFPAVSCEFLTVDISDALGTKKMNLSKTVLKVPIGGAQSDPSTKYNNFEMLTDTDKKQVPKYDNFSQWEQADFDIDVSHSLSDENFQKTLDRYHVVVVNFFASWCVHCQRLAPSWEAAAKIVHDKYPEWDGRIRFAKIDCVNNEELCHRNFITAFPSIRVFRQGHDDVTIHGMRDHESYTGDRTKDALVAFADSLIPSAGMPHVQHDDLVKAPVSRGCELTGYVLVNKVPGTLHIAARDDAHNFDHSRMNMTHTISRFYFASPPAGGKWKELKRLHPAKMLFEWMDRMNSSVYVSEAPLSTHEHYMQVVRTAVQPLNHPKNTKNPYDVYEYTVHSHTFVTDDIPSVQFTFDLSPMQILIRELPRPWYHFLTTTCAIIGGVFTVAGIVDGLLYTSINMAKKVQLGKQG